MIALAVEIEAPEWGEVEDIEALSREAAAAAVLELPDPPLGEATATLLLTDDASVRELNRAWRGQDKPTNVLSFPAPPPPPGLPRHLGDLALAYGVVAREAERDGKPLREHAAHLVVHGLLHLLGRDHETDPEADEMEALETAALRRLGFPDPYGEARADAEAAS